MPLFNQERFCREAIGSVLGQTLHDIELIIVNDGSTDGTPAIVDAIAARDRRVRVVHRRHGGISASCNLGILLARSEYLARADGDDLCVEHRLEAQSAFLDGHPNVAVLGGDMLAMAEDGRPVRRMWYVAGAADLQRLLLTGNPIGHPAAMFRRSTVLGLGGYRRAFDFAEDYDLWLRVSEHADLANLPQILVHYRVHGNSTTTRHFRRQAFRTEIARQAALCRRTGKCDPCAGVTVLDHSILDRFSLDADDRRRLMTMLEEANSEDGSLAAPY
jgi:glycosyltransferase involved in cell wall biosynthesis